MKRDLVIHYDEQQQMLICYSADVRDTSNIRARSLPLETPVDVYSEKSPDEAERTLGAAIFALLDLHAEQKIGIRDYSEETKKAIVAFSEDIEKAAQRGDAEAQYQFALELFSRAVRDRSQLALHEADQWLRKSAKNGSSRATEYLKEHWDRERASVERILNP